MMPTFEKPRILTDSEANVIRGKCLVAAATPKELMMLLGHMDLVEHKLRMALEKLSGCLPPKIYIYGAYGDQWSADTPDVDEYDEVDFKEVLGETE